MVCVVLLTFKFESVTVNVTVFVPGVVYMWPWGFWTELVPPSPKVHDHLLIVPVPLVDVSVKLTGCPTFGDVVDIVKLAIGASTATFTIWVFVLVLEFASVTVRVTVFCPDVVNVWVGFWTLLVPPSPKFQDQVVSAPLPTVDVSVNVTNWLMAGEVGVHVNEAVGAMKSLTVRVCVVVAVFEFVSVTDKVAVFDPIVEYAWLGFWLVLVVPSPKFHDHW
jgi:hypothetical protein